MKKMKRIIALLTVVCMMASLVTMFASAKIDRGIGDNLIVLGNIDAEATGVTLNLEGGSIEAEKATGDEWWYSLAQRWSDGEYWVCVDTEELYSDWFSENTITSMTVHWGDVSKEVPKEGIVIDKTTIVDMILFFAIRDEFKPKPTVAPTVPPTVAPTATPTVAPTATPVPTATPTVAPTATPVPTAVPTAEPTVEPTAEPDTPKTGSSASTLSTVFMALGLMGLASLAVVTVKEKSR